MGGSTATEAPPDTQEEHASSWPISDRILREKLCNPCQGRPYYIRYAFKLGWTVEQVHELTRIDRWFLDNMMELVEAEADLSETSEAAKRLGYSDHQLAVNARLRDERDGNDRAHRVKPVYKLVDTCAAEFEAKTPYY